MSSLEGDDWVGVAIMALIELAVFLGGIVDALSVRS